VAIGRAVVGVVVGKILALDENLLGGGRSRIVLVTEADLGSVLIAKGRRVLCAAV
jgi:hypothetical protein